MATPQPSRRAFTGLLTAGAGMLALSACTPDNATPPTAVADASTGSPSPTVTATSASPAVTPTDVAATPLPSATPSSAAAPRFSLTDPTSPWVVVNKHRPLKPQNFVPADLVQPNIRLAVSGEASLVNSTTAAAAEKMFGAAAAEGVIMTLASGYRSYTTQVATYNGYVASTGQAKRRRTTSECLCFKEEWPAPR
ncbi:D-alanyl-D-alanine carboxypeptidase family protein [Paenarthrobacter sp. RAF9]